MSLPHPVRLLLVLLTTALTLPSVVHARCGNFTPGPNPFSNEPLYTATVSNIRISAVVNCTGGAIGTSSVAGSSVTRNCNATNCGLASPENFVYQINSTLNVTVPEDQRQGLFDLIKLSTPGAGGPKVDMNATMFHHINQAGTCLDPGQAGYWNYAPTYLCVQGQLSDCSDGVASLNNQTITACGLQLLSADTYEGTLVVTMTSGVDPMPAPPNATASVTNHAPTLNDGPSSKRGVKPAVWGLVFLAAAFMV